MYSPSADCPASCVHLDSRALASSSKPLQILQVVLPKCILRGDLSTADDLDLADVLQNISYSRVTSTTSTGRALRAMLLSGIVHTRPVWGVVESTSNLWRLVRFHVDGSAMVAIHRRLALKSLRRSRELSAVRFVLSRILLQTPVYLAFVSHDAEAARGPREDEEQR